MLIIPIKVTAESFDIFIALEDDNIARLKAYDPGEVTQSQFGPPWDKLKLRNVTIGYVNEEDKVKMQEFQQFNDIGGMMKYLSRGWKYRPEKGDTDAPYESLRKR